VRARAGCLSTRARYANSKKERESDMKRMRVAVLCLAAMFAAGALVSASASAAELPAFYECAKTEKVEGRYTGKYTDKECEKEASQEEIEKGTTNKWELQEWDKKESTRKKFEGKSAPMYWAVDNVASECIKSSIKGNVTGPKTIGDITLIGSGCEFIGECSNTSTAGEVVFKSLTGEIGYINKTKKEVGVDLKPESGSYLTEFECGELKLRLAGSVIGRISPINIMSKDTEFKFSGSGGKQEIEKFETGLSDTPFFEECLGEGCTPKGHDNASIATTFVNKGEELMLKA
jgi:hypothetical protein